jgi:hypothetical protein
MTDRNLIRIGLTWIAGLLSFAVLGHGLYWAWSIDIRFNPALSILFCALPILSFPVFLIGLLFRRIAVLQPILAFAFFAVYSALNWRTCSALGYCGSIGSVVWMTLTTRTVLTFFGAAICTVAARIIDDRSS